MKGNGRKQRWKGRKGRKGEGEWGRRWEACVMVFGVNGRPCSAPRSFCFLRLCMTASRTSFTISWKILHGFSSNLHHWYTLGWSLGQDELLKFWGQTVQGIYHIISYALLWHPTKRRWNYKDYKIQWLMLYTQCRGLRMRWFSICLYITFL